jgi:hypothetical protein
MANPANSAVQNLLPVQALFNLDNTFNTFIGQGQPFFATINPSQSGLNITGSTINSTTIGATAPSTGVFTNIFTTTGQVTTSPTSNSDIANKFYVDSIAQGLSPKQAVKCGTTANITLSGLQTIDTYTTLSGDRVLVKNQTSSAQNGIYIASATAWTRSVDMDVWSEVPGAYTVVINGSTNANTSWVTTAADTGTIDVTAMPWVQFSGSGSYFAGTGLTLASNTFSITNTGVTATTYGSASSVPVLAVNAQGQITSASSSTIAITNTQVSGLGTMSTQNANNVSISGGSITGTPISGSTVGGTTITASTQFSGPATGLTGTAAGLSIGGNAATATSATTAGSATTATTATNIAGGAAGSVPYQSALNTTTFLTAGSNGQVLTLASGLPSWATPTNGTVTSVSGTGTVSGISLSGTVTTSGNLTLGGTLDLSSPPVIGGTTPNTITGSTINANTKVVSPDYYAQSILGGNLRTYTGTSLLNWDGGGSGNVTVNGGLLVNPSNKNVSLAPTGTGTVTINPTTASAMDNMAIGGTTPLAGTFTTLRLNTSLSLNGSTGTSGQILTSSGSGLPTWSTPASSITLSDDTTTNATRYPLYAAATSGTISTEYVASTKYQFNPSTGVLTSTSFSGAGTGLTGTASGLSIGGNAATATSATTATNLAGGANGSVPYQTGSGATTFLAAGTNGYILTLAAGVPTWAAAASSGITITDDTTTNATRYLTFTSATSGSITSENVSSTKLKYNPLSGELTSPIKVASNGINVNNQTVSVSYTIASGNSAMSAGPITLSSGVTVTISSGSRWVVL